ncbi:MAG: M15 family metallopeptidase [Actinomycetota bacterium]
MRRFLATATAAVVGLIAGGAVGLAGRDRSTAAILDPGSAAPLPAVRAVSPDTLLAWIPGGLPGGFTRRVGRVDGVADVTSVTSGVAWMTASYSAAGDPVDRPSKGLAIPLEVAGIDPDDYGPFVPPSERAALAAIAQGEGALGETSALLRRLGPGSTVRFGGRAIRVAAVLPDTSIGAHELVVSKRTAVRLGVTRSRYLLIDPAAGASRVRISAGIRAALPPGDQVQIRGPGETPVFRHGDAVLPQVTLKELFGEFAAAPQPGGYIRIDPAWASRHIVTTTVPLLGTVTCHRALIPQLRGALQEVARRGHAALIDPGDFGGCYSLRFLNRNPAAGLSHHAWGVALDVNVSANPFGRTPTQDSRLVSIFERWGFTWGGRWLLPDGMHFEFVRFGSGT